MGFNKLYDDKIILTDGLNSLKMMTNNYNMVANECSNINLRNEMLCILNDEHQMQSDIFYEMSKRGWYPLPAADETKVTEAKTKFTNIKQSL